MLACVFKEEILKALMTDEVVITGSATVCSLGNSKSAVWPNLLAGKSGIGVLNGLIPAGLDRAAGAQVTGLDTAQLNMPSKMSRIMNLPARMLLKCARDAFMEAGLDQLEASGEEIAFFAGMGMVDYELEHLLPALKQAQTIDGELDMNRFFAGGYREIYPLWPLSMLNNIGFCQTAISLGIKGENAVFVDHADAGARAIVEGLSTIAERRAKVALIGGVSTPISYFSLERARLAGILNLSPHPQANGCKPFSRLRSGTVLGEGCAVLVLESRSAATARRVPFSAHISGYGLACEKAAASPAATTRAIAEAAMEAIARAGLSPLDIDLVIAHGDGTWDGDKNEMRAIESIFSGRPSKVNVFSSRGSLGNCLAASMALDLVLAVCIIEHQAIPATLNCDPAEDGLEFNLVRRSPLGTSPKRILINARSPEGQCASLVVEACR